MIILIDDEWICGECSIVPFIARSLTALVRLTDVLQLTRHHGEDCRFTEGTDSLRHHYRLGSWVGCVNGHINKSPCTVTSLAPPDVITACHSGKGNIRCAGQPVDDPLGRCAALLLRHTVLSRLALRAAQRPVGGLFEVTFLSYSSDPSISCSVSRFYVAFTDVSSTAYFIAVLMVCSTSSGALHGSRTTFC